MGFEEVAEKLNWRGSSNDLLVAIAKGVQVDLVRIEYNPSSLSSLVNGAVLKVILGKEVAINNVEEVYGSLDWSCS
jgi:hypothetical protein